MCTSTDDLTISDNTNDVRTYYMYNTTYLLPLEKKMKRDQCSMVKRDRYYNGQTYVRIRYILRIILCKTAQNKSSHNILIVRKKDCSFPYRANKMRTNNNEYMICKCKKLFQPNISISIQKNEVKDILL